MESAAFILCLAASTHCISPETHPGLSPPNPILSAAEFRRVYHPLVDGRLLPETSRAAVNIHGHVSAWTSALLLGPDAHE